MNRPLSLLTFSQQSTPEAPARPAKRQFPVTMHWPADAQIAVIGGQWRRLNNGEIEATYNDIEELRFCITVSQWLKEWESEL